MRTEGVGFEPTGRRGRPTVFKTVQESTPALENKPENSHKTSLAPSLRHDTCLTDPDLTTVVNAWDRLPEAVRAGIVAMVKAASDPMHDPRGGGPPHQGSR